MSGLHRFLNYLVEFRGEGVEDPCHHNVVHPSPIDGLIGDVGEDMVVQGVLTKRENHEFMPQLVVG
jgi:hypothetical protein